MEVVPKTSATMKKVWQQVMADSYLSPLAQIMADVMIIIPLRQFWLRRMFFSKKALPKNRGGIC